MSDSEQEHKNSHLRRAAVLQHMADVHARAARVHNEAAAFFDQWLWRERAGHERRMAAGERQSAAAAREQASRELAASAGQPPAAPNGRSPATRN
jgi:hypothetical protein